MAYGASMSTGRTATGTEWPRRTARARWGLLLGVQAAAALCAGFGGHLATWSVHRVGQPDHVLPHWWLAAATVVAVLVGLLSVAGQIAVLLVGDPAAWWERLLGQLCGAFLAGPALGTVVLVGAFTLGSLVNWAGNLVALGLWVTALGAAAVAVHLRRHEAELHAAAWLVAAAGQMLVAFYAPWWLISAATLLNLTGAAG